MASAEVLCVMREIMLFVCQVVNPEGTWVQLDKNSVVEFCESDDGEAWSLARDRGGNQYLRHDEGKTIPINKMLRNRFPFILPEVDLDRHHNKWIKTSTSPVES